jgi:predicted metallopeptidase
MGYVIDIIIVMSCLFALVDSRGLDRISPAMVNLVLREYSRSLHKARIYELIKSYVNDTTLPGLRPARTIVRISELVQVNNFDSST